MPQARCVKPELLDALPPIDPLAQGSRRDLVLLNKLMGHAGLLRQTWHEAEAESWAEQIVDLGSGDGMLALSLVRKIAHGSILKRVVLVDRQPIISEASRKAFLELGLELEIVEANVFDWLGHEPLTAHTFTTANLFLHHFEPKLLRGLLDLIASTTNAFAACEPRRSALPLLASKMIGLIGCNAVTRHDALISVQAGFITDELSRIWPAGGEWHCIEREAGLFTHLFLATRVARPFTT
jgi:hypothetical protein